MVRSKTLTSVIVSENNVPNEFRIRIIAYWLKSKSTWICISTTTTITTTTIIIITIIITIITIIIITIIITIIASF